MNRKEVDEQEIEYKMWKKKGKKKKAHSIKSSMWFLLVELMSAKDPSVNEYVSLKADGSADAFRWWEVSFLLK